ncbi:MAG TPA: polysaccharide biosynthesis tyrosine autokinase [Limnobacter sp.]|nr:polysaccharide biosynthesis tyrosine autokinase [Limnobacter sp.]
MSTPHTLPAREHASSDHPPAIGHILVGTGKLTAEGAEAIVHKQRSESSQLFGQMGISMGLISPEDVAYAISRQFDYVVLKPGESSVSTDVVAAFDPFGSRAEAIRQLRTQLLSRWLETQPASRSLAVVSADRGEGRSYTAANLAVSFAQLGYNTLLIDSDLRNPELHRYFGVSNRQGLSSILQGRGDLHSVVQIPDIRRLSLLPSGPTPPNPQELLSHTRFKDLLSLLGKHHDLVILDTPAYLQNSDATGVTMRTGACIAVARLGVSRTRQLDQMRMNIAQTGGHLLGAALLDF